MTDKRTAAAAFAASLAAAAPSAQAVGDQVVPFKAIAAAISPVKVYPDMLFDGELGNGRAAPELKQAMLAGLSRRYDECVNAGKLRPEYSKAGCVFGGGVALDYSNGDQVTFMQTLVNLAPSGDAEVLVRQRVLARTVEDTRTGEIKYVGPVIDQLTRDSQFKAEHYTGVGNMHITYAFKLGADGSKVTLDPHKVDLAPYGYKKTGNMPDSEFSRFLKESAAPHDPRVPLVAPPVHQPPGAMMIDAAKKQSAVKKTGVKLGG